MTFAALPCELPAVRSTVGESTLVQLHTVWLERRIRSVGVGPVGTSEGVESSTAVDTGF